MELSECKPKSQSSEPIQVSDAVFGRRFNEALVHQVIVAYMANARQGTRQQKTRAEVAKSTRKPWKQKGTGRARSGMASSPIWRGGGRTFPSSPNENFSHKVNRKMYRAGMQSILSHLARENRLHVIENIDIKAPKTKDFAEWMKSLEIDSALIVVHDIDEKLYLASRNIYQVLLLLPHELDPYTLVRYSRVLMTKTALKEVEEKYA